jgi:uncharacterized membrane protein
LPARPREGHRRNACPEKRSSKRKAPRLRAGLSCSRFVLVGLAISILLTVLTLLVLLALAVRVLLLLTRLLATALLLLAGLLAGILILLALIGHRRSPLWTLRA